MQTVDQLVDFARLQGEAFAAGKVATSNTLASARVQAILPAIKAIEAGEITLTSDLPGLITRAYAGGARIEYKSGGSERTAVSKTAAFLIAADKGLMVKLVNAVENIIREQNDSEVRGVMEKGIFEKLNTLSIAVVKEKMLLPKDRIMSVLAPVATEPTADEQLRDIFKKLSKLCSEASKIGDKYSAMAVESLRFGKLSDHHAAEAKRKTEALAALVAERASIPAEAAPVVTLQSNNGAETTNVVNDAAITGDVVDEVLDKVLELA